MKRFLEVLRTLKSPSKVGAGSQTCALNKKSDLLNLQPQIDTLRLYLLDVSLHQQFASFVTLRNSMSETLRKNLYSPG